MKLLGRIFALFFTLLMAALVCIVYLLHSPNGLEWTYRIAATLLPGKLTIERLGGHLSGPLTLRGVRYRTDKMDLQITQFDLQWQPGALMNGRLLIDDLTVTGLHIDTEPSAGEAHALPDIHIPIRVDIAHAAVHDWTVAERGGKALFSLTDVNLTNASFNRHRHRLQLQQLTVNAPHYQLTATGNLTAQRANPLYLSVTWTADIGEYGKLAGQGKISGDLQQLNVHQQVTAPARAELDGVIINALTSLGWRAELSAPGVNLQTLRAGWPDLTLSGSIRGSGTLRRARAEGVLHSRYRSVGADHRFALAYENDALSLSRFDTALADSGAHVNLHGSLTNLTGQPQAALEGTWQALSWPLQGKSVIYSKAGRFSLAGTFDHYRLKVGGDLHGQQIPYSSWSLSADGTPLNLTFTHVDGTLLEGSLSADGNLAFRPQLNWDAVVRGNNLNPGTRWPGWPGRLAFTARSSGTVKDGIVHALVELVDARGHLRSIPIDGNGTLKIDGNRLALSKLRIDSGDNHFTGSGSLQDQWLAQWQITAADLAHFLPGGAGRLLGSGGISGPRDYPVFTASMIGQQLKYANMHIGEADLAMAVDTQGRLPSLLQINARDASRDDRRLDAISLRADGTAQRHQVRIFATATHGNAALKIDGHYGRQQWTGAIVDLDMDTHVTGHWKLAEPARAAVAQFAAHLDELCLQRDKARFCAKARWAMQDGWQSQASLRSLPLSAIKDWMPGDMALAGDLDADVHAGAAAGGPITGMAAARLRSGMIFPGPPGKNETPPIAFRRGQFSIILDERALSARAEFDLPDGGNLQGSLKVTRIALPAPLGTGLASLDTALLGQVHADVEDLGLLPALIPGVEHTQGHLTIRLSIAGSLDKPRVLGELRLENGSAAIPVLGINPAAIRLVVSGNEQGQMHLDLQLRSGGGTLHLAGDLSFDKTDGLSFQAQLNGDKAEIVNTPEFHILASPDIHLQLHGQRIDLDGDILVPEANLRPRDVSGAVSASDDVVILGAEKPSASGPRWLIYSQLRIRLGDFVKFSGFGLQSMLKGNITIVDAPQRPTVARGELNIINGQYHAYGQKLEIDRGRLLFFGGPVDNPGLDIRAVRRVQDAAANISVGISVRGTIKAPQVQLFSDPTMADSDILAYLLTGQPLNQATASQGQQLYGAALSLGLAGGGLLANQIGQRFGIDNLTVESGGSFGGGALVIRHYLSPKLYISYGVGLIEHFNVVLMRYQISRHWSLEAGSGTTNGADVVYTLERKQ